MELATPTLLFLCHSHLVDNIIIDVLLLNRMIRATFYFSETLQQRLKSASKKHKKSVSKLAQELLDQALATDEQTQLDMMYQALQSIIGVGKDVGNPQSVNEILYGENGAWRGSMPLDNKG